MVYKCPPEQHDDLGMSLAMLAWAAQHVHLNAWQQPIFDATGRGSSGKNTAGHRSSKQSITTLSFFSSRLAAADLCANLPL